MGNTFTHRNSILSILKTSKQLSMPKQVNISKTPQIFLYSEKERLKLIQGFNITMMAFQIVELTCKKTTWKHRELKKIHIKILKELKKKNANKLIVRMLVEEIPFIAAQPMPIYEKGGVTKGTIKITIILKDESLRH